MRSSVVFMGTPAFAASILAGLLDCPDLEVTAVYTQPDRPAGRGKKLLPPPVKKLALERGLPVYQPASLKFAEEQEMLRALRPDFLVVCAYGLILPKAVLECPRYVPINVHTSLLPAYRGAAPVQRAIMDGVEETGVCVMRVDPELDAGPVYARFVMPTAGETAGSLFEKMAARSVPVVCDVLAKIRDGVLEPVAQQGEASYAAKISKAEGQIDFFRPLRAVDCHIRGVTPDPGAHVTLRLAAGEVSVVLEETRPVYDGPRQAGLVLAEKGVLLLTCEDGCLSVLRLKPAGKNSMDAAAFVNGQRLSSPELREAGVILPPSR